MTIETYLIDFWTHFRNLTIRAIWCVGCWRRTWEQCSGAVKAFRTGMVVETFGGQVMETVGIENDWVLLATEGPMRWHVEEHVKKYQLISWRTNVLKTRKRIWLGVEREMMYSKIACGSIHWCSLAKCQFLVAFGAGVILSHVTVLAFTGKKVAVIGGRQFWN